MPGEFHGQRSLACYSPRGHKQSDTTEGFTSVEIIKERKQVGEDAEGKPIFKMVPTKKTYKQIAPNVQACQYWLENRCGGRWSRNPVANIDEDEVNSNIQSIADLLNNPVKERERE